MIIGVGIDSGDAVIGEMGPPETPILFALGESVNTAARLERITKEMKMPVAVSSDTRPLLSFRTKCPYAMSLLTAAPSHLLWPH